MASAMRASGEWNPKAILVRSRILVLVAQFIVGVDYNIVYVALPEIESSLGFTSQSLQWVVSAFAVAYGGLLLFGGSSQLSSSAPPSGRTGVREDSRVLAVVSRGRSLDAEEVRRGRPRSHSGACEPVVEHGGGGRPREPWIGAMSPSVRLPIFPVLPTTGAAVKVR